MVAWVVDRGTEEQAFVASQSLLGEAMDEMIVLARKLFETHLAYRGGISLAHASDKPGASTQRLGYEQTVGTLDSQPSLFFDSVQLN